MEFKDYYQVLGIESQASADEIKRAYRKLARKYHPDVSREPDAEERFKEVNEAYEVLKDPEKRQAYDELKSSPFRHGRQFEPPPDWQFDADFRGGGFTGAEVSGFSEFFRTLFGDDEGFGAHVRGRPRSEFSGRGEDVHSKLEITLPEAYSGATRRVRIGTPTMTGDGRVTTQTKTLEVKVPAGVTQGRRIRLRGQGGPGIGGGPAGDLYCEIDIAPHPWFAVDGRDVTLTLPVTPWEVALGGRVEVPTLGGRVGLTIPAGSRAGSKLRLRGQGLPGNPPGDQIVVLKIVAPAAATDEERAAYAQMAKVFNYDPRREAGMGGRS